MRRENMKKRLLKIVALSLVGTLVITPLQLSAEDIAADPSIESVIQEEIKDTEETGTEQPSEQIAVNENIYVSEALIEGTQEKAVWEKKDNGFLLIKTQNEQGINTYYVKQDGFITVGGEKYLFDENGFMYTGIQEVKDVLGAEDGTYYFQEIAPLIKDDGEEITPANSTLGQIQKNVEIEKEGSIYRFGENGLLQADIAEEEQPMEDPTIDDSNSQDDAEIKEEDAADTEETLPSDQEQEDQEKQEIPESTTEPDTEGINPETDEVKTNEIIKQEDEIKPADSNEKKDNAAEEIKSEQKEIKGLEKGETAQIGNEKTDEMGQLLRGNAESGIMPMALQDEAINIELSTKYTGHMYKYSSIVCRFVVPQDAIVGFQISYDIDRFNLELYNSLGTSIHESYCWWNSNIEKGLTEEKWKLKAGIYYLKLSDQYGVISREGDFIFSTKYNSINSGEKEPNDTMQTAQKITSNKASNGMISYGEAEDFYYFDMKNSGRIQINLRSFTSHLSLYLYNSSAEYVSELHVRGGGMRGYGDGSMKKSVSAGRYYIRVCRNGLPDEDLFGKYALQLAAPKISATNGWVKSGSNTYYYINGKKAAGWRTIAGNRYYFSQSTATYGRMLKGWQKIGSYRYYFAQGGSNPGHMLRGWQKIGSYTYYFARAGSKPGRMLKGWQKIGSYTYYFAQGGSKPGHMLSGWQKIGSYTYYFARAGSKPGHMLKGWQKIGNRIYYFDAKGRLR